MVCLASPTERFVAALGNISRDLFAVVGGESGTAFYCMGSMGSVVPFTLGLALSRPDMSFTAIEGDGSLIMNLGCLLTVKKCATPNLKTIVLDNRCYESTGGQPSQPEGFSIASMISSVGLSCFQCETKEDLEHSLSVADRHQTSVIVVSTKTASPGPRINLSPLEIQRRFSSNLGI